jgi:hypothetical protein
LTADHHARGAALHLPNNHLAGLLRRHGLNAAGPLKLLRHLGIDGTGVSTCMPVVMIDTMVDEFEESYARR